MLIDDEYSLERALEVLNQNYPHDFKSIKDIFRLARKGKLKLSIIIKEAMLMSVDDYSEKTCIQETIDYVQVRIEPYKESEENTKLRQGAEVAAMYGDADAKEILSRLDRQKDIYYLEKKSVLIPFERGLRKIKSRQLYVDMPEEETEEEWGGWMFDITRIDKKNNALIGSYDGVNEFYLHRSSAFYEELCTKDDEAICIKKEELLKFMGFEAHLKEYGFALSGQAIYLTQGCAAYWVCESMGLLSDPHDKPAQIEYETLDQMESYVREGAIRLYSRNTCGQMQEREYDADALFLMSDLRKLVADKYPGQKLRGDDHFVVSAPLRYIEIIKQASIEPDTAKEEPEQGNQHTQQNLQEQPNLKEICIRRQEIERLTKPVASTTKEEPKQGNQEADDKEPVPILYKPETQREWVRWKIKNEGIDKSGLVKPRFRARFLKKGREGFSGGVLAKRYDEVVVEFRDKETTS